MESTKALSSAIASDIENVILQMQLASAQPAVQSGKLDGDQVNAILEETYGEISSITSVDALWAIDKDNIVVNNAIDENIQKFGGADVSQREYVKMTRETMQPYVSSAYKGLADKWRVSLTVPIIKQDSGEYLGMFTTGLSTVEFFERYGNLHDLSSQSIVAYDKEGNIIALSSTNSRLLGMNFFEEGTQNIIGSDPERNRVHHEAIIQGKLAYGTYIAQTGERFGVASPVFYNGKQVMTLISSTPTSSIYSQIENALSAQSAQTILLLAVAASAVSVLVVVLLRHNIVLDKKVNQRTSELQKERQDLEKTNIQLKEANEELELHDKMQQEFVNIAAHELRTPVQPILTIAEMLGAYDDPKTLTKREEEVRVKKEDLRIIARNATRLERLSADILDVSRIEGGQLKLVMQSFDLNELVKETIDDIKKQSGSEKVKVIAQSTAQPSNIVADKQRITQVISNLLNNAMRFTAPEGTITITTELQEEMVKVTVKDDGTGIATDIFPRLFTRFGSTLHSSSGTGLGLYICKAIVEAHGGKIWAQNNDDGKGALFAFTLPITASIKSAQPQSRKDVSMVEFLHELVGDTET
jgi:signal transduction histidine kinase